MVSHSNPGTKGGGTVTDSPTAEDRDDDVADSEAEAIASEISAEQIKPDGRLTAPTTGEADDDESDHA